MWGHYAQNHKGVCFGFDLLGDLTEMEYVEKFIQFSEKYSLSTGISKAISYAQRTKSKHWEYENEWRAFIKLTEEETELKARGANLFFCPFGEELRLKEIIIGQNSQLTSEQFRSALGDYEGVEIKTARASFRDFKIVEQKNSEFKK